MKKRRNLRTLSYVAGTIMLAATAVQAQVLVDTQGGVEVWRIDQPAPGPGYEAFDVVLKTTDEAASLVTFENVKIEGQLVQTWLSGPFGTSTPKNVAAGPTYPADWVPYDSHLSITSRDPNMIGGQAGDGFTGIDETNDMTIGEIPGLSQVQGTPSVSGLGPISMVNTTDAFFLDTEFQGNEIKLAYVVQQLGAGAAADPALLTIGVLGEGIINSGDAGGAQWGFLDAATGNHPAALPLIPEPASGMLALISVLGLAALRRRM